MVNRRELIKLLMLGVSAVAFGPLVDMLKPLAVAASSRDDDQNFFVEAQIRAIEGNTLMLRRGNGGVQKMLVTPATDVWKGSPDMGLGVLRVDDWLYARGVKIADMLTAVIIWANIVNFSGVVTERKSSSFAITDGRGGYQWIDTKVSTEYLAGVSTLGAAGQAELLPGKRVQIIGVWNDTMDRVTASRIFVAPSLGSGEPSNLVL